MPHSGEAVQLLDDVAAEPLLRQFMGQSALHDVQEMGIKVVVETHDPVLYQQVADNLLWYGFEPSFLYRESPDPQGTTIRLKGGSLKGSYAHKLTAVFRQDEADIIFAAADESEPASYHVDLGRIYNPCLPYLEAVDSTQPQEADKADAVLPPQKESYAGIRPLD